MRARLMMVAIAGLSLAAASSAQPAKDNVNKAGQPTDQAAPVVVASADEVSVPAGGDQQQAAAPAKPARHARVTTCRCGDQTSTNND